jgi:hypothetical protein
MEENKNKEEKAYVIQFAVLHCSWTECAPCMPVSTEAAGLRAALRNPWDALYTHYPGRGKGKGRITMRERAL